MKIVFIIATLQSGGAERVLVNLANELVKTHSVEIIKFDKQKSFYALDNRICVSELPPFCYTNLYHKIMSRFKKFFALKRALKASNGDVFISFLDTTNIFCIWASLFLKTPLIISEHSTQSYLKPKIWRFLRRFSYPYAAALSVLSEADKSYYQKFIKRVKVIYNACQFEPQTHLKKENSVLFIGRLDANKNAALFIKAISLLPKELANAYKFIIAGDGEQRSELEILARDLDVSVEFKGRVSDIAALYKGAKMLCLCSFVEGLPTVLIESLFFGVARISTDYVNSARDLIKDGVDGLLVPVDNPAQMALKMQILMSDEKLRQSLVNEAYKRCANFSPAKIKNQWLEFIAEVKGA